MHISTTGLVSTRPPKQQMVVTCGYLAGTHVWCLATIPKLVVCFRNFTDYLTYYPVRVSKSMHNQHQLQILIVPLANNCWLLHVIWSVVNQLSGSHSWILAVLWNISISVSINLIILSFRIMAQQKENHNVYIQCFYLCFASKSTSKTCTIDDLCLPASTKWRVNR